MNRPSAFASAVSALGRPVFVLGERGPALQLVKALGDNSATRPSTTG